MLSIYVFWIARVLLLVFLCFIVDEGGALARDTVITKPGIWCERRSPRRSLSSRHEQRLVMSLARITGFCELHFGVDGELCLGDTSNVMGGSEAARQILQRVLGSSNAFVIEDCSGSDYINFGQVVEDAVFENADGTRLDIWRVRIDFSDFQLVQAPADVRASFDEGFILLHELLHGLGYADASGDDEIGQCEARVNQARAELGLPQRDQYFVAPVRVTDTLASARIRFRSRAASTIGHGLEWQYLYFLVRPESRHTDGVNSAADRRR